MAILLHQMIDVVFAYDTKLFSPLSPINLKLFKSSLFQISPQSFANQLAFCPVFFFRGSFSLFHEVWWEGYGPRLTGAQWIFLSCLTIPSMLAK